MSVITDLAGRLPRRAAPAVRTTNIILLALVAGLGVAAYLALHTTASVATATPRTSPVAKGVVLSSVSASGTVQAATNLSVGFEASGRVTAIDVKAGQKVAKGQVLGKLDSTDATAAVKQAEANLASAQANLAQAKSGETAQQKAADAVAVKQSKAQVTQAETALKNARTQLKIDDASTRQSVATAKSSATLTEAQKQLKADRGNLAAAVAKQKADKAKLTINGTTYATADEAVNAMTNIVNQDKSQQQANTQTNYDLQTQQTMDQQQLALDQTSQKNASASDQAYWQDKVSNDQATVNADALKVQQMAKVLNAIQYQSTQDQATLQTLQTLQTSLTQDTTSIQSYEAKIVADNNAISSAKSQRTSQIQTAQSMRTSTLAKDNQAIVQAKQQVSSAKLAVTSTAANNVVKSTTPPATLAQDSAQVLQAQVSLASAKRTLDQTVLRAPAAGTVASVGGTLGQSVSGSGTSANSSTTSSSTSTTGSSGGSASSSAGSTSSSSSAFVTLVNLQGLQVTASFSETDAAKIRLGQAGTITVSALPNKQLAAHVVAIDTSGTSSSGVVTYTVTMALDRTIAGLKPGMSANASVTTGERDNVLNVPNAAVTGSGSNATVKVLKNGVQSTVNVVAGLKGDSATEIVSGLTAGQQVVTSSGLAPTAGAGAAAGTTRPGGAAGGFPGGGGGFGGGGGGFGGGGGGGAPRGG
ncbi:MAG TPA: biotin/lipoyl-binding protein [Gaiellaceae bacterium]|jgi:macrolide-specific efflux system membrane fusion protein|nr:biotin/lipoyl-binding protein [Gaiellaceae bacterium]